MKRLDFWKWSLRSVFSAPLRSALTVAGIAVGVGAILAVLTLGDAGKNQVQSELRRLGIDQVWLTASGDAPLRQGDAQWLGDALQVRATEQAYVPVQVSCGQSRESGVAVVCSPAYLDSLDANLSAGRNLYPLEWTKEGRSVLMGRTLAEKLHAKVDGTIYLGGRAYILRGILEKPQAMCQVDVTHAVFLPMEAMGILLGKTVHEITLSVPAQQRPQSLAAMAQRLMSDVRGVETETLTMQVQMEAANSVVSVFVDVLTWVAFICTLVGGIGVMNILLVSVRERRREIGVMKSLGATQYQVCMMFLQEALIYAACGGLLGILTGIGLIEAAGRSIGLSPRIDTGDCALVLAAALAVGLVFGAAPAMRAGRLRPVDALRDA